MVHGPCPGTRLAAHGDVSCRYLPTYLSTYLHTLHTQLGQALTVPTFERLRLTSVDYNPRLQI